MSSSASERKLSSSEKKLERKYRRDLLAKSLEGGSVQAAAPPNKDTPSPGSPTYRNLGSMLSSANALAKEMNCSIASAELKDIMCSVTVDTTAAVTPAKEDQQDTVLLHGTPLTSDNSPGKYVPPYIRFPELSQPPESPSGVLRSPRDDSVHERVESTSSPSKLVTRKISESVSDIVSKYKSAAAEVLSRADIVTPPLTHEREIQDSEPISVETANETNKLNWQTWATVVENEKSTDSLNLISEYSGKDCNALRYSGGDKKSRQTIDHQVKEDSSHIIRHQTLDGSSMSKYESVNTEVEPFKNVKCDESNEADIPEISTSTVSSVDNEEISSQSLVSVAKVSITKRTGKEEVEKTAQNSNSLSTLCTLENLCVCS